MNDKPNSIFKGYISEEGKRKYSIRVGVICGLMPVLQVIVPYLLIIPMMISMNPGGTSSWRTRSIHKSVLWQGAIWFVSEPVKWRESEVNPALMKLSLDWKQEPVKVAELPGLRPWLFVNQGKLWILSATHAGFFDGDTVVMKPVMEPLENISRPFLYDQKPTVLGAAPDGIYLAALEDGGWTKKYRLAPSPDDSFFTVDNYEPISSPSGIYIFHKLPGALLYRKDLSLPRERKAWDEAGPLDYLYYYPTVIGDEPAIFTVYHQKLTDTDLLTGLRLRGGTWRAIFSCETHSTLRFAVFPSNTGSFFVITEDSDGNLITFTAKDGRMEQYRVYRSRPAFPVFSILLFVCSYGLMLLAPLALVLLVAWMMRKYRTRQYEFEGQTRNFATVTRRSFAYLIDSLIISVPPIAAWIVIMWNVIRATAAEQYNGTSVLPLMLGGIMASIVLMLAGLVLFSYLEGKYGQTPGKRILRIKTLGTELIPCGFGRAILRNLLLLADGFWNGLVGIALIAYSENWQRVGDLAARTIVVDVSGEDGI